MVQNKKIEKALYGPSMTEVALGAFLGLIVGVLAACIYLVFKPVAQVKDIPKEPVRGTLYYIPGSESTAKSKAWQTKYKQFAAGGTFSIDLVEDELNAWAASLGSPAPAAPAPAKPGAPKPAAKPEEPKAPVGDGIFNPGKPNFRIVDGKLQIGTKCVLNWYGLATEVTVKVTGVFRTTSDGVEFAPDTVYLGSCPLHLLPAAAGPLFRHLVSREHVPDEVRAAWAKLHEAKLEGNTLKLVAQ